MSASPADLGELLARLRGAGLRVGVTETARLERVLALEPRLDPAGLERLVAGVVAKSKDEVAEVGRVVGAWRDEARAWLDARRQRPRPAAPRRVVHRTRRRRRPLIHWRRALVLGLLLGGLEAALLWISWPRAGPLGELAGWPGASQEPAPVSRAAADPWRASTFVRPESFVARESILRPGRRDPPPGRVAALLGAGVLLAGGLWLRYRGRRWRPPPAPPAERPGPSRVLLRPPASRSPRLLAAAEEEALVWGIERFVSEEPSERLDVAASVAATCRHAGRPALEFERARHHREVWLWCDASVGDPFLGRLAAEIQASLAQVGLVVERTEFWGVPHRLLSGDGRALAPSELDERRDAALVAVLTDGRLLSHELDDAESRPRCAALLRDLGRWPRLAFVDFGDGRVRSLLGPRRLRTVAPSETFAFLGGVAQARRGLRAARRAGDAAAWEAACALPSQPVAEADAHALRQALGLRASAWTLRKLFAAGARRHWRPEERARRLRWLLTSEGRDGGDVAGDGLLGRALDFWEARYAAEDAARRAADAVEPWVGTPAEQRLELERALLRLWRDPEGATDVLYGLFQARHRQAVGEALGRAVPADRVPSGEDGGEALVLPWAISAQPPRTQVMLREMGLGASFALDLPQELRRPGRLWLASSLCLGAALGGGVALAVMLSRPAPLERAWRDGETVPCTETVGEGAELWRCGYLPESRPVGRDRSGWRFAIVDASPGLAGARVFAARLLDSGSVDEVLLSTDWRASWEDLAATTDAVLVFSPGGSSPADGVRLDGFGPPAAGPGGVTRVHGADWQTLARGLSFGGVREAGRAWPGAEIDGDRDLWIAGLFETHDADGSELVWVPSGVYGQGADDLEQVFLADEGFRALFDDDDRGREVAAEWAGYSKPVHEVPLSGFWIARYPVTRRQYRRYLEGNPGVRAPAEWDDPRFGQDLQPVVGVDWGEARAYCRRAGMDLPTEAQWEAAARGSDPRRYPWGDESPTPDRADFGKEFLTDGPAVVDAHPSGAGPYGTLGQAGGVLEWCRDPWNPEAYEDRDGSLDPIAGGDEGVRVLRGGSWLSPASGLASAFRDGGGSSVRDPGVGFRCVLSLPSEP